MFYVYILYSKKLDTYYVGSTSQTVTQRLQKHLSNHAGYTSKAKDWEIVYCEEYSLKTVALKRENEIKRWKSKIKIKFLIDGLSRPD
ncbi:GIY-YIG nuclease family protein [Flavobacterium sp. 20NA77.7]|uniref:GIY-YIG nuclease family protein n=1 Tax=Flavobacterium nakdongensis TaxID=3073563 RepID=A0ABY9RB84_9FLAO|nr:GIY-YIG nuclease family protein [Flavobacterium sp. 20NA77.7]WMW78501.1 GIY-YIG nuclease family protein [Flavobacterium sp. 20NA77.7]